MEVSIPELKEMSEKLDQIISLLEGQVAYSFNGNNNNRSTKRFMRVKDVANYLCISKSTIYRLTSEGRIPHKKICSTLIFSKEEIDNWL